MSAHVHQPMLPLPLLVLQARVSKRSTLAAVLEHIFSDNALSPEKQRNIRWALRKVVFAVGKRSLEDLPADPGVLRKLIEPLTAAMAGITPGSWKNALALTRFALRHVGLMPPTRRTTPFDKKWTALIARAPRKHDQIGLSRLARYCTSHGISPDDLTDTVFAAFLKEITEEAIIRQPNKVHRRAALIWNRLSTSVRNWPNQTLTVPCYSRVYFLGWDKFLPSLSEDVDAHLRSLDGSDIDCALDVRPLKPRSIRTRRHQLGAYLSALILRGEEISNLRTLEDAVEPSRVKSGLNFFLSRPPEGSKKQAYDIARVLLSIARHWDSHASNSDGSLDIADTKDARKKARDAAIVTLAHYCKRLKVAPAMGEKTLTRLYQFDDDDNIMRLLGLPELLINEVRRISERPGSAEALKVQTAMAVELLLMVPIRRENLANLKLDEHLVRDRSGRVTLRIPGNQVKNGVAVAAVLPDRLLQLIDFYIAEYRPLLDPGKTSTWMFPGLPGRRKSCERLASQVSNTIKEKLGLLVNVHLFRSITGKLYLDRNPGGYGVVKALLGHKLEATTIRSYCGLEGKSAFAHYDKFILEHRQSTVVSKPRKKRAA